MGFLVVILMLLIVVALLSIGKMSIFGGYSRVVGGTSKSYIQLWESIKEGVCSGKHIVVCDDGNRQTIQSGQWNVDWDKEVKAFLQLVGELKLAASVLPGDDRRFKGKIDNDVAELDKCKVTSVIENGRLNSDAREFVVGQLDKFTQYTAQQEESTVRTIQTAIRKCIERDKKASVVTSVVPPIPTDQETVEPEYLEDLAQVTNVSPNGSVSDVAQRATSDPNVHDSRGAYHSVEKNPEMSQKEPVHAVQKEHKYEFGE